MTLHAAFRCFLLPHQKINLYGGDHTYGVRGHRAMTSTPVKTRGLYDLNPQIAGLQLGEQSVIHWRNNRGDDVDGILIKPRDIKTYSVTHSSLILTAGFLTVFFGNFLAGQLIATQGYVVLLPNFAFHTTSITFKGEAYSSHRGKHYF